jgi:putative ABC transport system permease protein
MFRNYLITALQYLRKQPGFSVIKILSLTLGLSCALLVMMHVQYIYSFDRHFDNWDRIFRIVASTSRDYNMAADAYGPALASNYAQIEAIASMRPAGGILRPSTAEDSAASFNSFFWVEPSIVDVFSLDFVQGDPATALLQANAIVINESTARKYFGTENPLGQVLVLNNDHDLQITGVMRDLPVNTYLQIEAMIPVETARRINREFFMNSTGWVSFGGTQTFFRTATQADGEMLANDMERFVDRNINDDSRPYATQVNLTLSLEALSDVYLSPRAGYNSGGPARARIFYGLVLFAALILLTSCINFANLSLSQVQQRSREIGVRKAVGATGAQIVTQFLIESLMLTAIALLLALPIVYFAIPVYTNLTDTAFQFGDAFQSQRLFWLSLVVIATGVLSGIVPALSLSRFEAARMVKSVEKQGRAGRIFRSVLTVFQFSLSTTLVILAVGIALLVEHLNEMPIGFNRHNLLVLDRQWTDSDFGTNREEMTIQGEVLMNEFLQHPGILSLSQVDTPPPSTGPFNPWRRASWPENRSQATSHIGVDANYFDTMQLQLLAGRSFSAEFPADFLPQEPSLEDIYGVMITRSAVDLFELGSLSEAIGEILQINRLQFRVVGVVEDFRLSGGIEDPTRSVLVMRGSNRSEPAMVMRIDPAQTASVAEHISEVWARLNPGIPVDYEFFEEQFEQRIFESTNGVNQAAMFAAVITIVIALFGLYALALNASQRRTREVGVRKTLGASTVSIVGLLTWDFIKPVLVASVIA